MLPEPSIARSVSGWAWPAVCAAEPVTTKPVAVPAATATEADVPVLPLCDVAVNVPEAALPV